MKKLYLLVLALILALLGCLAGCEKGGDGDETTAAETESGTVDEGPTAAEGMLLFAAEGKTSYKIINGGKSADENYAVRTFAEDLSKKIGATVEVCAKNTEASDYEIIIGRVDERQESRDYYANLSYTEYGVEVVGNKIIIGYYEDAFLDRCLDLLKEQIKKNQETGVYELKNTYRVRYNQATVTAPVLDTEGTLEGVYSAGSRNYEAHFKNAKAAEFDAYVSKLGSEGYTVHATNTIGNCKFGTYIKDNTQVNVCWYPAKSVIKIIYGPKGYLPSITQETAAAVVTPSVTQMDINAVDVGDAPGMSYVIQLSDGRFVIVDGGGANTRNQTALYNYLQEHKVGEGKPVIAAWINTHAHGDHLSLAQSFLETYYNDVELQAVAYNYPDLNNNSLTHEDALGIRNAQTNFATIIKNRYSKAKTIVMHTGMKFWIGDAEFEVLSTHEDFFPGAPGWGNDLTTVFRVNLGGKLITFLGDCEVTNGKFMADVYGSALKCDILQLSHHGYNGGVLSFYQAADPDICFWPTYKASFESDARCLGTEKGYDFNAWIRNNSIKQRKHYHASELTTISLG